MSLDTKHAVRPAIAVAPMMDWTDRHCRFFLRQISPSVFLYTEMVTAAALHHGDADRLLEYNDAEHPVALQVGGSDPVMMTAAAKLGEAAGYDEINLNVGCPSDRVQSGSFGACLMARPEVVADCLDSMRANVSLPLTVKTRIGIDNQVDYAFLQRFVERTMAAGCETFIVHARKAILKGLSPKENRTVPPLDYDRVYRLKSDYPELTIMLNGGVTSIEDCERHLAHVDGVMIGRKAYQQPWFLAAIESRFGSAAPPSSRHAVVERMLPYLEAELARGTPLKQMTRHMLGLFAGEPGARAWRRELSEHAHRPGAGIEVVHRAVSALPHAA